MTLKLELPRFYIGFVVALMGIFIVVGVTMLVMTIAGSQNVPPPFVSILWCAILGWNIYAFLGIPYRIDYEGPDSIRFVSLRGTTVITAAAIKSLKGSGAMYVLRHDGGKIRLLSNFTGLYEMLSEIKKSNPQFQTRGI